MDRPSRPASAVGASRDGSRTAIKNACSPPPEKARADRACRSCRNSASAARNSATLAHCVADVQRERRTWSSPAARRIASVISNSVGRDGRRSPAKPFDEGSDSSISRQHLEHERLRCGGPGGHAVGQRGDEMAERAGHHAQQEQSNALERDDIQTLRPPWRVRTETVYGRPGEVKAAASVSSAESRLISCLRLGHAGTATGRHRERLLRRGKISGVR